MSDPASIGVQPWMRAHETTAVLAALEAAGGAGSARFVGGCVRNAIRGEPVADVDIATTLTPERVSKALNDAGLKAVPTGFEHGTITAVVGGKPFEVTTLRRDVETDGRHAVVAFTTDWAEDAARRDFRLNAIYADAAGRLYDPTGEGVADARAGRVVFVGDAGTRIREDALRILRFFRFYAWYGREAPDATGLAACAAMKDLIGGLSAERVAQEPVEHGLEVARDRVAGDLGGQLKLLGRGADEGVRRLGALEIKHLHTSMEKRAQFGGVDGRHSRGVRPALPMRGRACGNSQLVPPPVEHGAMREIVQGRHRDVQGGDARGQGAQQVGQSAVGQGCHGCAVCSRASAHFGSARLLDSAAVAPSLLTPPTSRRKRIGHFLGRGGSR
jgi:hypothetical protein